MCKLCVPNFSDGFNMQQQHLLATCPLYRPLLWRGVAGSKSPVDPVDFIYTLNIKLLVRTDRVNTLPPF